MEDNKIKKVGIITHYYNNKNYGGSLQAYALAAYLNKNNCNAEQISYNYKPKFIGAIPYIKKYGFFKFIRLCFLRLLEVKEDVQRCILLKKYPGIKNIENRNKYFDEFAKKIPHSAEIYTNDSIKDCKQYDCYITGSDQVWNMNWYYSPFFLDFVDGKDKIKMSYSASMPLQTLTNDQKLTIEKHLQDFKAISVREKTSIDLLKSLCHIEVVNTIDPTLLLEKQDWDELLIADSIEEEYLFCYFLGDNYKSRCLAKEYAVKNNLKIVNIPHMNGFKKCDLSFADYDSYDVGPQEFISLIKNSKMVFTDSFHAVIFSHIYEKEFFVFLRDSNDDMSSRIVNILDLFECNERFCTGTEKESIKYIESCSAVNYSKKLEKLEELKEFSKEFLRKNTLSDKV